MLTSFLENMGAGRQVLRKSGRNEGGAESEQEKKTVIIEQKSMEKKHGCFIVNMIFDTFFKMSIWSTDGQNLKRT